MYVTKLIDKDDISSSDSLLAKASSYTVSKVGKAGSDLKSEQLQAVCHMYTERDVLL